MPVPVVDWLRPARTATVAVAIGFAIAIEMYVAGRLRSQVTVTSLLTVHLAFWLLWAACVPLVVALSRRVARSALPVWVSISVHFVAASGLAFSNAAVVYGLRIAIGFIEPESATLAGYLGFTSWQFTADVLAYGMIVAVFHISETLTRAREREVSAANLRTELAMARLAALRGQVHPHFLFNTLNSISALIDDEPAQARRAVTLLADLLRLTLARGDLHLIPLREELEFAERYLAIQQIRYGERLRVARRVDAAVLDRLVPSFVLLPLVENAVKHGVARHRRGGHVELHAMYADAATTLVVANNGTWHEGAGSPGTGLATLRRRLSGLFGTAAVLEHDATTPGTVTVRVIVPTTLPTPAAS